MLALYERFYAASPFVTVFRDCARRTCRRSTERTTRTWPSPSATASCHVLSAIDNLGKGAAGQAIQNMNLMLGLPEEQGLDARTTVALNVAKNAPSNGDPVRLIQVRGGLGAVPGCA